MYIYSVYDIDLVRIDRKLSPIKTDDPPPPKKNNFNDQEHVRLVEMLCLFWNGTFFSFFITV